MITITHTHAEGTLIKGSRKGDGVYEIVHRLHGHWRPFRSLGCLGLLNTRDKPAKTWMINAAAEALRAAGYDVTVTVDDSQRRSVAEVEADRAERAEARAERLEERAERRGAQAQADYERARQLGSVIPLGQPVMPDHYSYRRDMNYRAKIGRTYDRAFRGMDEAEELQRRARSAEATQSVRESVPTTLRRIAKLEAERRSWQRAIEGEPGPHTRHDRETWACLPAEGRHLEHVKAQIEELDEQLDYWRGHVAAQEANGVKVWTRADFTRGDFVLYRGTWYQVLRVNAKSVSIAWTVNPAPVIAENNPHPTWPRPLPYDKAEGRKSAEEIAALT